MTIQINREISIPIYTQIVGQIQFDIVSGRLPSGTQLPSIRELAQELAVAPMTITQAYQELRQLGLIEMRHGSGTFVADFGVARVESVTPNRQLQLRRIVQRAIGEARQQGFAEDEIKQAFLSLLPAPFTPTAHFGLLCAAAMVSALAADLLVLPPLLARLAPR